MASRSSGARSRSGSGISELTDGVEQQVAVPVAAEHHAAEGLPAVRARQRRELDLFFGRIDALHLSPFDPPPEKEVPRLRPVRSEAVARREQKLPNGSSEQERGGKDRKNVV